MRIIGNDPNTPRQTQVVASGTLSTGDTIVVNADGTVSAVAGESATQSLGSDVFVGVNLEQKAITYDTTSDKVIIAGQNSGNSNYGTACVGTVSGTSISFGSPAQYAAVNSQNTGVVYDAVSDRVIIAYTDNNQSGYLKAVVGQVSGTTMTFGSIQTVGTNDYSNVWSDISLVYDSSNNKSVMIYADGNNSNYLTARTVTVNAGTNSMTFGTPVVLYSALAQYISSTFDSTNNKVIVTSYTSGAFRCFVGTVSGTSISFGSAVSITGGISTYSGLCFDSTNGKVVVAYSNTSNSSKGTAVVGTVSGSSISFGTAVVFEEAEILRDGGSGNYAQRAAYDSTANRVVVSYQVGTTAQQYGRFVVGQVSGTSITFGSAQDYNEGTSRTTRPVSVYDPDESKVVFSYKDPTDSNKANAQVLQVGYENTNLTAENYIGTAKSGAANGGGVVVNTQGTVIDIPVINYILSGASYDSKSFSTASQDVTMKAMAFNTDGTKMYLVGTTGDAIYQYSLSTAFDVSTASYDSVSFSVSSQSVFPSALEFNNNGTKMYVGSSNTNGVFQYSLSSAFDLSTASYDSVSFDPSTQETSVQGIQFNNDGTKLYIIGTQSDAVFQYSLSSAFDLSTTSYDSVSFSVASQSVNSHGLEFNNDGTKLFVCDVETDTIYQYNLTTGFDLSTASYSNVSLDVSSQDAYPAGMAFNSDGSKMYIVGDDSNYIYQYSTAGNSLTAGQSYYVQTDGTLSTTAGDPSVFAGTAVSATKLIVKGQHMLKVIGGEQEGEFKAVASGTLPNGKPVVVNSDGTVSVVGGDTFTEGVGSETVQDTSGSSEYHAAVYDPDTNKVIIAYRLGGPGYAAVGTVSGTSITFGTRVQFDAGSQWNSLTYDATNQKIVIFYQDQFNSFYGQAIVGTVSGTSISFGTPSVFKSAETTYIDSVYDPDSGNHIAVYRDGSANPYVIVGSVSGTSISFGSEVSITPSIHLTVTYDTSAQKAIIAGAIGANGYAQTGTVSGTSISLGSATSFGSGGGNVQAVSASYDTAQDKTLLIYKDEGLSSDGYGVVASVSGTSISFGSATMFSNGGNVDKSDSIYFSAAGKHIVTYTQSDSSPGNLGRLVVGTISGTSVSFTSIFTFNNAATNRMSIAEDTANGRAVIAFADAGNSTYSTAVVYTPAYQSTNLTAENYIGMSQGVVTETSEVVGTESVFDTTTNGILDSVSVYDPDTQKTIIAYADRDNGDAVTAVVATVTGTTLSFGTPVVAHAGSDTEQLGIAYDTTNDRVVICYKNVGNSNHGTAVVGQVSGTSITFGTPVVFAAASTSYPSPAFDANSGKIVISYMDAGNSNYGTAIVGTVSGTSISFGTEVVFNSGVTQFMSTVYDPSSQKTVIAYRDSSTLNRGEAIVGTVSGTSISFGSVTLFDSTSGHEADNISAAYDPDTQQVIVAYREDGVAGDPGRAVVGTVSGTSITFGDAAEFSEDHVQYVSAGYDTVANKVVIAYRNRDNSDYGTVVAGSIDGTSLSFETPVVYSGTDAVLYIGASFNEAAGSFIISYRDVTSLDGTAVAYQASYIQRYPVADGDNASLDIIGSVSDNQLSLTAGEKYYVQTDGTLSTTAGTPSVLAGTAISATKLVVKT